MLPLRAWIASALVTFLAACGAGSASLTPSPLAQPSACDSVVARSAADPTHPVDEEPRPDSLFLPPQPVPRAIKGQVAVAEFVVDPAGQPAQIAISGIADEGYTRRLRTGLEHTHFTPARRGECRVFGVMRLNLQF
jgi:hypothetical protein